MKKRYQIFIIGIICISIIFANKVYAQTKLPNFDAEKLLCCYSDNVWNVDNLKKLTDLVKKKEIKMTGIVSKVDYNYIDGYSVTIRQKRNKTFYDGWNYIKCYFKDEKSMDGIKSGNKITVRGYCKGWEGIALCIYGCELVEIY